jgi:plasmid stability protein
MFSLPRSSAHGRLLTHRLDVMAIRIEDERPVAVGVGTRQPSARQDPPAPNPPGWRSRRILIAFCDMKTLYLRNVPDDVSQRLASLAAREGLSVSSFALRELGQVARRADNPALLGELPDLDVSATDVIADLEAGRSAR